ncbi:hypothetical protein CR513_22521, partial [Mucuna pruriens]
MVKYEFIGRRRHVDTWADLKRELISGFVLALYARDFYNKMQHMYQGSKSIEDYQSDMEVALTKANVLESNEETMTHFLHELNRDIQDIVKLYHYISLDNLVHQEIRVKAQRKRHMTSRKSCPSGPNNWKGKEKKKERPRKGKIPKKGKIIPQGRKEERTLPSPVPVSKSSSIKCFKCLGKGHIASQCPNKRRTIMPEDGTVDNDSSKTYSSSNSDS